ncbi:MAG TPA: hypothetical protein EYG03_30185 [Planctomycetes bacterium]|nr:hypothetical protein [Fuerstiella sp.]HIK96233.1 hypothetical protein [Planctomycetota bacterium]
MSFGARCYTAVSQIVSLGVIVAIAVILLRSKTDSHSDLLAYAAFVDRDEYRDISVLRFEEYEPTAGQFTDLSSLRQLSVEDTSVAPDVVDAIGSITGLRALSLAGSEFNGADLSALDRLPELQTLNLSRTQGAAGVLSSVNLTSIETLKLNDCSWVDDDLLLLLQKFSTLQTLEVSGSQITDDGINRLLQLPKLRWLNLSGCEGIGTDSLRVLSGVSNLKSLTMSGNNLSVEAAFRFQKVCPLTTLYIPLTEFPEMAPILERAQRAEATVFCRGIHSLRVHDDTGVDYSVLKRFPGLRTLQLTGSGFNVQTMSFLADMKQLDHLQLGGKNVTDDSIQHLSGAINLTWLDLSGTSVTDAGVVHLLPLTKLRQLDLSGTDITADGLQLVSRLKDLQYLEVRDVSLSVRGLEVLKTLPNVSGTLDLSAANVARPDLEMLRGKSFKSVNLSGHSLSESEQAVLATWTELESLDLSHCAITGEHLKLSANTKLKDLRLDGAMLTDATLQAVEFPPALSSLSLSDTSITGENLTVLQQLNFLRSLDLSRCPLSEKGVINVFALKTNTLILHGIDVAPELNEIDTNHDGGIKCIMLDAGSPLLDSIRQAAGAERLTHLSLHGATDQDLAGKNSLGLSLLTV